MKWRTVIAALAASGATAAFGAVPPAGGLTSVQGWQLHYGSKYKALMTDSRDLVLGAGETGCRHLETDAQQDERIPPPPHDSGHWHKMVVGLPAAGRSCANGGSGNTKVAEAAGIQAAELWVYFRTQGINLAGFGSLQDLENYLSGSS